MALHFNKNVMGKIVITQEEKDFELDIRQGNCLGVIIHSQKYEDGYIHTLADFFLDEQHLKNRCKAVEKGESKRVLYHNVKSIRLNMKYKESATILKHLVKYYAITCYYE